jgi:diaminohydroxyphosphoribosylaminopyrimidine deaminase/5-amino-6-(5-phosphoribosylamino)uracil reductase
VFLRRACELAERGRGSTSPNPSVGAVFARGATTLGEGYHHMRGEAHAEVEALRDAARRGSDVTASTLYVTLEPCNHTGLTPPCSEAVVAARVERVVVGTADPNPRTAGAGFARLRAAGIVVDVAGDPWSRSLIEDFERAAGRTRPYVRLKLAASLDGYVAPRPGERYWLTGEATKAYVRELRATYDAVLVGAGTVRADDPQLTVRPPRARRTPYRRVVACERGPLPAERAIFAPADGYAPTIVLAPSGRRTAFASLAARAEVVYVGPEDAGTLDLEAALDALRARGIASVLCEGGPTLAAQLVGRGLVDRVDWFVAPVVLQGRTAVPALANHNGASALHFDRVEQFGPDVLLSAAFATGDGRAACSAD